MLSDAILLTVIAYIGYKIIEKTTDNLISRSLIKIWDALRFRFRIELYAKSRMGRIQNVLIDINYEVESVKKDCKIVEVDQIKKDTESWGIIQFGKGTKKEEVEEAIVSQLPAISMYKRESQLLMPKLRKSLFDQFTYKLASKLSLDSITQNIMDKADEENRIKELEIFENILKDKEKLELFRQEARRRLSTRIGKEIEIENRREFSRLVEDISKGLWKIITIFEDTIEYYFLQAKSVIKTDFIGLYLLARGRYIKKLNNVKEHLISSVKKLKLKTEEEYNWIFPETNKIVKAKMCVFENIKKLRNLRKKLNPQTKK